MLWLCTMKTIDLLALENVTGGAKKLPKIPKAVLPKLPAPAPAPAPGLSFCQREPFACANMGTGGNI